MLHMAIFFLVLRVISSSPVQNETWETNEQLSKAPPTTTPSQAYKDISKRSKERPRSHPLVADDVLQDVWKRSTKEQDSSNDCICQGYNCCCCSYLEMDAINLNDTVCTNFSYLPMPEYGISVTLIVGNDTVINETMSARNPAPLCEDVPDLEASASLCLCFKTLKFQQYSMSGCVRLEARLKATVDEKDELGCFKILPQSQTHPSQQ